LQRSLFHHYKTPTSPFLIVSKVLLTMSYLQCILSDETAQTAACSIVMSKLDYCNDLLFGALPATFNTGVEQSSAAGVQTILPLAMRQPVIYKSVLLKSGTFWPRWSP